MSGFQRLMAGSVALGLLAAASPPAPIITAGQIVSTTVDVTQPPPAPLVKLQVKGLATLMNFNWTGPSGETFNQQFSAGTWQGASVVQGLNSSTQFGNAFNLYTEAGTWTLTNLYLCGSGGTCSSYSGKPLATLFGRLTIQVANPNPADFEAPKAVAGVIDTPTVSLSTSPTVKIGLAATDNLSGIAQVSVCAATPGTFFEICVNSPAASSVVLSKTYFMTDTLPAGVTTGTYTIDDVYLQDSAGNSIGIYDAPTINKLFYGHTTITVTK